MFSKTLRNCTCVIKAARGALSPIYIFIFSPPKDWYEVVNSVFIKPSFLNVASTSIFKLQYVCERFFGLFEIPRSFLKAFLQNNLINVDQISRT